MCLLVVCAFFVHVFIFLHHPVIKLQFLKLAFFFFFLTIREINIGCSKDMDGWGLNQRPWLPQRVELGNYIL